MSSRVESAQLKQAPYETQVYTPHTTPTLTPNTPKERDQLIAKYLRQVGAHPPESWNGPAQVRRENAPAYFQYPAMMSPAVQRDLLRLILHAAPHSTSLIDPFCGSGTVLSEAMYAGLECWASDMNPLAVLLCQVKSGAYAPERLDSLLKSILTRVASDRSRAISTDLPNWQKWFRTAAARQLSSLRRSIRRVRDLDSRRFFWACIAETVRTTSNSRTSTYKLHIRPGEEIEGVPLPIEVFKAVAKLNIEKHRQVAEHLSELKYLDGEKYSRSLEVHWQDAGDKFPRAFDILMTSPPYGDNVSTVPYGQSAYLPLQWIDLSDIGEGMPPSVLCNTQSIDNLSLGGRRPRWAKVNAFESLRKRSPSLDALLRQLARRPHDRTTRVLGFVRDLDAVLPNLLTSVRAGGYLVWTVGNRRVGGHEVPLADILCELVRDRGIVFVGRCKRRIPHKRMPSRNSISPTIKDEHVIVFRRVSMKPVSSHG
jgi:hypothetical protein